MGTLKTEKCFITDLPVQNLDIGLFDYEYSIDIDDRFKALGFPCRVQTLFFNEGVKNWCSSDYFLQRKHIFAGTLINNKLFEKPTPIPLVTIEYLRERFNELIFPNSPQEKLDNLLLHLFKRQEHEGEKVEYWGYSQIPIFYYGLFLKSSIECNYYFNVLHAKGLIKADFMSSPDKKYNIVHYAEITFDGLDYIINITENGKLSKKCFIAMSFNPKLKETRQAIKNAITETGFDPILIDEIHYQSDKTINDAIIASLKSCKFCVADFTEQKDGVYFESGFALGQGKPVIYTCKKEDFEISHFDTNHFPHIIYNNPDELKQKLIDKINAWIK